MSSLSKIKRVHITFLVVGFGQLVDVATTYYAINYRGFVEGNPFSTTIVGSVSFGLICVSLALLDLLLSDTWIENSIIYSVSGMKWSAPVHNILLLLSINTHLPMFLDAAIFFLYIFVIICVWERHRAKTLLPQVP